ncbi:hypothetical protein [Streptomyces sp. NPDC048172]|uniref:hypothetical protein n=1 Tax=Streptomyces sp. NPDC048172 TaxID=3365505 RepID=UPI003719908A
MQEAAAVAALAASGGTALVQAAGTDAWQSLRDGVARWFGRGDDRREGLALERLDRTEAAVRDGDPEARAEQRAAWRGRFADLLEELDEEERESAASELRELLGRHGAGPGVSAGAGGVAVGGDFRVTAEGGSFATGVHHGDVTIQGPPEPDQGQG